MITYPEGYEELTKEEKDSICNGCGAKGWGGLIPDTIWFLDIKEACDVHDYMYHKGYTLRDKDKADRLFFKNMVALIDDGWPILRHIRKVRATAYYKAVSNWGHRSFFDS